MPTDPESAQLDWPALAAAVKARRKHLRLAQPDLAAGPGEATVRRIERGEARDIRNATRVGLETSLGWSAGHVDRILTGRPEPTGVPGQPEQPELPSFPVIVYHLPDEHYPGRALCCDADLPPSASAHPRAPLMLCGGCRLIAQGWRRT